MNGHDNKTPEHLGPLERAARIYCERTGQDPDEEIAVPHPVIANYATHVPVWRTVADRLFDLSMLLSAMKAAKDEPKIQVTP